MKLDATLNTKFYNQTRQQRHNIKLARRLKKREAAQGDKKFKDVLTDMIKNNEQIIKKRKV